MTESRKDTSTPLERLVRMIELWQDRVSGRRHLMALDERTLGDLGLSRCDAEREGAKPFWRP